MKKRKKAIIIIIAILFLCIAYPVIYIWMQTGMAFNSDTLIGGTIVLANILIIGSIGFIIFRKTSLLTPQELKKRIVPNFLLFVLLALIISLALIGIIIYIFSFISGNKIPNFFTYLFSEEYPEAIKQFGVWILFSAIFFFYTIWQQALNREHKLYEENLKYRYITLKSQVSPHFLFNSFNTLSELISEDARKADSYLQRLSKIYRYVLENEEVEYVQLEEEIKFVQEYFSLQKERVKDKILLEIDINRTNDYKTVPISLQLLVENALKHNSMSRDKPLKIKISGNDDYIMVTNNIQRRNIIESSTKMGLVNLMERVRLIMDKELIIKEENNEFVVKLPIIRLPK
jgi:two-component system LytT family sensor kinase